MVTIGIDPAFRKDGFAVCIIDEEKVVDFRMFPRFGDFIRWLTNDAPERAVVGVENSNEQECSFDMRGSKSVVARKSRNVGKNQAISQCTVELCQWKYGGPSVLSISPKQKGRAYTQQQMPLILKSEGHKVINYKGNKSEEDKRSAYKCALFARNHFRTMSMSTRRTARRKKQSA